jgi:branched-chain amino acid transport system permease protein
MKYSKIGRAIRAVSQDETGSLMVGIDLNRIQTLTLALSCALAALAGACLLFMYPAYPTVGLGPLFNSWFIVILAGMGNVAGAAVGAFIVALLQVLTTVYVGEGWEYTLPSVFIIAVLIFKPSGIFGGEVRGILNQ